MTDSVAASSVTFHATGTPLESMDRLGARLGFSPGELWVKRDDLTGLPGGGNKARKLEYLCADAITLGADTLLTGGAPQSNHVRMTAAAARRCGLEAAAVLRGDRPGRTEGNLVLDDLFGLKIFWAESGEWEPLLAEAAEALRATGANPYPIPIGGSSPVGALGYVRCADELSSEAPDRSTIVIASGSGGTHAGLVAGFGDHSRVWGVGVGAVDDLAPSVRALARATAEHAGRTPPEGEVRLDEHLSEHAYGAPIAEVHDAIRMVAELEGLVLDPVYTGRAMAGFIAACRRGEFGGGQPVVFIHTGGLPALLTSRYSDWFPTTGT